MSDGISLDMDAQGDGALAATASKRPPSIQGVDPKRVIEVFKAVSDDARLRIMLLLRHGEMSVKELCEILDQSQPRISRHIKILADAELIDRSRQGSWLYCRLNRSDPMAQLIEPILASIAPQSAEIARDINRLNEIKAQRIADADAFFEANAQDWERIRALQIPESLLDQELRNFVAEKPVSHLLDVGTGSGQILVALKGLFETAIGIDISSAMLRVARGQIEKAGLKNVELTQANIENLPENLGPFDCVLCHHALHFLRDPAAAIIQLARCVAPQGRLIIVDYLAHRHQFLADDYHHLWLGFDEPVLRQWIDAAGLRLSHMQHYSATSARAGTDDPNLVIGLWIAEKA